MRYITDDGSVQEIEGNEGESLMLGLQAPPAAQDEEDLLELIDDLRDDSRLGCQIRLTAAIDGIIAKVVS